MIRGVGRWFALALLGAILSVPLLLGAGRPEGAAISVAFSAFCHQQPERSWTLAGVALPVCVRCLGVYVGAAAALWMAARFRWGALAGAALLIAVSLAWEAAGGPVAQALRCLAGAALGWGLAAALPASGTLRQTQEVSSHG